MKRNIVCMAALLSCAASTSTENRLFDLKSIEKYRSVLIFTGGFLSGSITGFIAAIKTLKKKYEKKGDLTENIKEGFKKLTKEFIGG